METPVLKRAKPTNGKPILTNAQLKAFVSAVVSRAALASQLGTQQYGGDRDIHQALGYLNDITYSDYLARYERQDIAKAIIDRPVKATWHGPLEIIESGEAEETGLEREFRKLERLLGLKTRLARVDRLASIGEYGILLLGLDDVRQRDDFVKPVGIGKRKLVYVKPFGQDNAPVIEYEANVNNSRYGLPLIYELQTAEVSNKVSTMIRVHYSRVIHIVTDTLESEVIGAPVLESVFNRLMDLEKLVGGDAEMFWRGARPGYVGKVDPAYQMTATGQEKLREELDEFDHHFRRFLISEGIDLEALAQQIADPAHHVDVQIQMISAVTGIPKRILTGSERGELSSTQDEDEWFAYIQARRLEHAEPHIILPFVDRCIELGVLPKPADTYMVKWQDPFSASEKSRVDIGRIRATALKEYTVNPMAELVVPPDAFMEFFLGMTTDQIELIQEMRSKGMSEDQIMGVIEETVNPTAPAASEPAVKPENNGKEKRQ